MGLTITHPLPFPERRGWTRAEFERLAELGFFAPDERLELIEGEIVRKMTRYPPHATAIYKAQTLLLRLYGAGYMVRVQLPLSLGEGSRPEPDLAVVEGVPEDYSQTHPTSAVLVVEVSDTTLLQDREVKAGLYAREGIAEYWIINLLDRVVEVYRQPAPMAGPPLGYGYRSITHFSESQTFTSLAIPHALSASIVAVSDLLP